MEHNIRFFDTDGTPIEFNDRDGVMTADIYIEPVSVSLYDTFNLYMMEEYRDGAFRFPVLSDDERYLFRWNMEDNEVPQFFMYDILRSADDHSYYIDKKFKQYLDESVSENVMAPFQVNIGFSPTEEVSYRKSVLVIKETLNENNEIDQTLEFVINLYSEGIEEDPRFRIQLENFGIRLNKTDALAIKDYNVSEAYPDWDIVNNIRKHLILEKEELVPYLGTYRCLANIISLFGYGDSIDVREYYKNINPNSEYFGKYSIVSIMDYMDNGKVDKMNLVDRNISVRESQDFQKCGMLALAYEFTKKSGKYDANGTPIIERNDEFTTDEMFFKLHKLKNILERDYLPVNVFIHDVIGEWNYYISFSKYVWSDNLEITTMRAGDKISISVYPEINHHIYDVSMLHTKRYDGNIQTPYDDIKPKMTDDYYDYEKFDRDYSSENMDFPKEYVGKVPVPGYVGKDTYQTENFYGGEYDIWFDQTGIPVKPELLKWNQIDEICESIEAFYAKNQSKGLDEISDRSVSYVNSYRNPIGFPAILSINLLDATFSDIRYMRFYEFGTTEDAPSKTFEDILFRDYVEAEWHIEYNTPADRKNDRYVFHYTGPIRKAYRIPQLFPYTGTYDVSVKVRNVYGLTSYVYKNDFVVVDPGVPQIVATYPGDDVFDFTFKNLEYSRFIDFGATTFDVPRINVLDNITDSDLVLDPNVISTSEILAYKDDTEVYNSAYRKWEKLSISGNQNADNFGFGDYKALKFSDFKGARFTDLFHLRPIDCVLTSDMLYGFYFHSWSSSGSRIYYRFKEDEKMYYEVPSGSAQEVCRIMNDPANVPYELSRFTYYPLNVSNDIDREYYGDVNWVIVAEARDFSPRNALRLEFEKMEGSAFTFEPPICGLDSVIKRYLNNGICPEYLSTTIDRNDIYGNVEFTQEYLIDHGFAYTVDRFDEKETIGYLPTLYDMNYINQNTCKLHTQSFSIPRFKRVIFFVNNIVAKDADTIEWVLKDVYGNVVIDVRKNPYFIYNFTETGNYELDVTFKDNNGNSFSADMPRFINVLGSEDYMELVKSKLMNRKADTANK